MPVAGRSTILCTYLAEHICRTRLKKYIAKLKRYVIKIISTPIIVLKLYVLGAGGRFARHYGAMGVESFVSQKY